MLPHQKMTMGYGGYPCDSFIKRRVPGSASSIVLTFSNSRRTTLTQFVFSYLVLLYELGRTACRCRNLSFG
ncbi:hypothetical protein EPIB2_680 [Tritonibacter mobilis]|nr:hypothetical protein EPIB2_680 [Tritonibacter mobilis]